MPRYRKVNQGTRLETKGQASWDAEPAQDHQNQSTVGGSYGHWELYTFYKIPQDNINHCSRAQDLLLQCMAQCGIKLAVVSESYVVPDRGNWLDDLDDSVVIIATTTAGFEETRRRRGYALGVLDIGIYAI